MIRSKKQFILIFFILLLSTAILNAKTKKALTYQDIMKFKSIEDAVISDDGAWITYTAQPDRGDGAVIIQSTKNKKKHTIQRGTKPIISHNSKWVLATILPTAEKLEKLKNKKNQDKDKPKNDMAYINTDTGEIVHIEKVSKFVLSEDSNWLAYQHFKEEDKETKTQKPNKDEKSKKIKKNKDTLGSELILVNLNTKIEKKISFVHTFAFDTTSHYFTYSISDTAGKNNGLYYINLEQEDIIEQLLITDENGYFSNFSWNNRHGIMAYFAAKLNKKREIENTSLWIWNPLKNTQQAVANVDTSKKLILYKKNKLTWTHDGQRLFFGLKPESEIIKEESNDEKDEDDKEFDPYNIEDILEKRAVNVWHWNDSLIIPNQKMAQKKTNDRTYKAIYNIKSNKYIALADKDMPYIQKSDNRNVVLGSSDLPYLKYITWDDRYYDYYLVNIQNGSSQKVITKLRSKPRLSPAGNYIVYYKDKHWYLYDCKNHSTRNLTKNLNIPFFNEDHDYPVPAPGYGMGGWTRNEAAVLIYDKYDIWKFSTENDKSVNLTAGYGRKNDYSFRIHQLNPTQKYYKQSDTLLLSAYHQLQKQTAFYSCQINTSGIKKLLEEKKKFKFLAKAKNTDIIMYSRESYTEYPDLWIANLKLKSKKKITNANSQINEFAWGSAELVEWRSMDGIPLQGILIKPGNYESGKKYPVLVYFYRFFSQRLHEYNETVINHRPCFPFYASNGYAIFLPDIRFEIGRPGFSATKCIVPGVQKLIDMGIADPDAIALHGHSWSGYQTAMVITQSDIFKCAIAGAPVSNMTSAYSGIRWKTGLARQFQYEQSQSRLGANLWQARDRYIDNSPVFFADKINTPLLIMFGDEDGAVPWYQGIELYLAMRRLEKDCIFLQYRGEPHHPKKYHNKLDYTIRMKQYLDYHLKRISPEKWITDGVPYKK